jgi:hypothetical protein
MMLDYIDWMYGATTVACVVFSFLLLVVTCWFVTRNTAARVFVLRALMADPRIVARFVLEAPAGDFLIKCVAAANGSTGVAECEVKRTIDLLVTQQLSSIRAQIAPINERLIELKTNKIEYDLFFYCTAALRQFVDNRELFNKVVENVTDAIMKINIDDMHGNQGFLGRVSSMNWISWKLGGGNRNTLKYFVRFILRDIVHSLANKIIGLGFSLAHTSPTDP